MAQQKAQIVAQEENMIARDAQVRGARVAGRIEMNTNHKARMKSQDERKLTTQLRASENGDLFYVYVQIPLLMSIRATPFREGDMCIASQIVASIAENLAFPQQHWIERRAREPPDKISTQESSWPDDIDVSMRVPMGISRASDVTKSPSMSHDIVVLMTRDTSLSRNQMIVGCVPCRSLTFASKGAEMISSRSPSAAVYCRVSDGD